MASTNESLTLVKTLKRPVKLSEDIVESQWFLGSEAITLFAWANDKLLMLLRFINHTEWHLLAFMLTLSIPVQES